MLEEALSDLTTSTEFEPELNSAYYYYGGRVYRELGFVDLATVDLETMVAYSGDQNLVNLAELRLREMIR